MIGQPSDWKGHHMMM